MLETHPFFTFSVRYVTVCDILWWQHMNCWMLHGLSDEIVMKSFSYGDSLETKQIRIRYQLFFLHGGSDLFVKGFGVLYISRLGKKGFSGHLCNFQQFLTKCGEWAPSPRFSCTIKKPLIKYVNHVRHLRQMLTKGFIFLGKR